MRPRARPPAPVSTFILMPTNHPLRLVIIGGVAAGAPGQTSFFAAHILAQNGFRVSSLTGGIRAHFDPRSPARLPAL